MLAGLVTVRSERGRDRLGVSVRLLYSVFAGRRHSLAAEVRRRRLDATWRDLQDPARAHLCVIDIAVAAGFPDVTSFHRAFRREYGRTPAQVRRGALGAGVEEEVLGVAAAGG